MSVSSFDREEGACPGCQKAELLINQFLDDMAQIGHSVAIATVAQPGHGGKCHRLIPEGDYEPGIRLLGMMKMLELRISSDILVLGPGE